MLGERGVRFFELDLVLRWIAGAPETLSRPDSIEELTRRLGALLGTLDSLS